MTVGEPLRRTWRAAKGGVQQKAARARRSGFEPLQELRNRAEGTRPATRLSNLISSLFGIGGLAGSAAPTQLTLPTASRPTHHSSPCPSGPPPTHTGIFSSVPDRLLNHTTMW